MTYQTSGYSPAPVVPPSGPPTPDLPPAIVPAAKRNSRLIAGSIAVIAVCGLAAGWALLQATARDQVLAVVKPVSYGQKITAGDLGVARVASDPNLDPIAASQESQVVGQVAAANLAPGTLLVRGDLSSTPIPGTGQTVAYVPISDTRISTAGLAAGQQVVLVYAPSTAGTSVTPTGSAGSSTSASTINGTVLAVAAPTSDGTIIVTVIVSTTDAATLAQWSATESVELTAVSG
jgi:hypothetical protein